MADTKISALSAASTLAGTEELPVVQGGTSKKATVTQVAAHGAARMQTGTKATGTLVAATATTIAVPYPTPFTGTIPKVNLTIVSGAGNERRAYVIDGTETLTGFSMSVWRATGTASFDVNWLAVQP